MTHPFPRPLILGHRGAPFEAPENTVRAFELALAQGADGVELDVQRARDGVPVVIHDARLERTTDGHGEVAAVPWAELSRLSVGGEPLPSLEQAAAWAARSGAWLNVELKARGVEDATLTILETAGLLPRCVISSFDPEIVGTVAQLAPRVQRFLLTETWDEEALRTVGECDAVGVCLRVDAAGPLALEVLRAEGLPVIVWTVDDPDRMQGLLRAGVAGLITNRPALGVAARRAVQGEG